MPRLIQFADDMPGVSLQDNWDDIQNASGSEDLGYPTQKPLALLERIIQASSNPGDLVLDPFCGCGTTIHAAEKLGRRWIGIDVTHLAISLIERRLKDAFPGIGFEVFGRPQTLEDALALAERNKYQFQYWALSMIDAQPVGGRKKGADKGVDGLIWFRPDGKVEKAVVSVKGGANVGVAMIRDLVGVMEREKAPIGVFITVALPSRQMESEAAAAGFYQTDIRRYDRAEKERYPRVQILTLAELFDGKRPRIPRVDTAASFKSAPLERRNRQRILDV